MLLENIKKFFWEEYNRSIDTIREDVGENIGVWKTEYERHPDTNSILSKNSYLLNEEEVLKKADERFCNEFLSQLFYDSCEVKINNEMVNELMNWIGEKNV